MNKDENSFKLLVLSEAGQELILNENPRKLLDNLFNKLSAHLGLDLYLNYIFDEELDKLRLMNYHGITWREHALVEWIDLGEAVCGEAARKLSRIIVEDIQNSADPRVGIIKGFGLQAYVSHPLVSYGKLVGTLSFGLRKRPAFSSVELDILQNICSQVSIVLDRILLISALKKKNRELAQKNRELRHSEEQLSAIFSVIPSPMLVVSLQTHQIIEYNEPLLSMLGMSGEELLNRYWPERHDENSLLKRIWEVSLQSLYKGNMEVSFENASGQHKVCLCQTVPVDINQTPGILTVFSDLTEHKEYEKEMVRLDQLHLIGEMAAGIGHEVRNPLTTVRGFLQLMSKKESGKQSYLEIMIEELDRANSIISEFLGLAKNQRIDMKYDQLNELIAKILPLIQADATVAGKTVDAELGPIPPMYMDERMIRQLILNMVRNGLEAMPPEGRLIIRTYTEEDAVILSVEDNGKGIPSDQIEHIWKPFYTTKESGSGLGLAVCFNVANKHGAKIDVVTGPTGTTFSVRFKGLPA
ncbi:PAS domain S-box-containing protein [Paenibacillus forsythiae]|uniref:histidine kinase n=1 Tax=Paenibacillus forsythiae TaxID=365616 RepID=A0ABU3HBN0_9BACL|nr:ATP-binding protein [Paenibacillus forsythiae]MDT3427095.1 PAS domain S-box-containing protein [Paenibacillus forsythiae]